ncbi:AGAP001739-PA-like protein [Anopheles sinensis]|uniref:AGAP001739-PA-like protein n=1 Tax=Anopheles sinensis TaxID=74873 RepID=A0A084VZF1_ANOSI|nr:AGAP001739-PA-like protein [Anopheles sinensis]
MRHSGRTKKFSEFRSIERWWYFGCWRRLKRNQCQFHCQSSLKFLGASFWETFLLFLLPLGWSYATRVSALFDQRGGAWSGSQRRCVGFDKNMSIRLNIARGWSVTPARFHDQRRQNAAFGVGGRGGGVPVAWGAMGTLADARSNRHHHYQPTNQPTDGKRDSVKSTDRGSQEEDARRSRSLDGEAILEPIRQMDKNKNKSAWSKVKGIVKNHRGSLKSNESRRNAAKPSNSVGCSREASPCESMDACEMAQHQQRERSDSFSSSQTSPGHRSAAVTPTFLLLPASTGATTTGDSSGGAQSGPNSPCGSVPTTQATFSSGDDADWRPASVTEYRTVRSGSGDKGVAAGGLLMAAQSSVGIATNVTTVTSSSSSSSATTRSSRKSKHIPDIESVPEGVPIETKPHGGGGGITQFVPAASSNASSSSSSISKLRKSPPKPLSLSRQQESIDVSVSDQGDSAGMSLSSSPGPKHSPKRKSYAGLTVEPESGSLPASPSGKQFTFFGGNAGPSERVAEIVEADYSSGDVSDQNTPKRRPSPKHRTLQRQREEIERRYQELQLKLQREFDAKQQEWERMRPAALLMNNSPLNQLLKEDSTSLSSKAQPPPIVEDNLTPDFKKKLNEWRSKQHQPHSSKDVADSKKKPITDWQLWKTGQIKLEGQGLKQLPDAKDLPEDFQKKLSEWKQMKAANKVPAYSSQTSQVGGGEASTSMKRQQTPKGSGGAVKKSKTSDELEKHKTEGLSKLKALVGSEAPKKELVVQTTKGFIKFEGISRKFTRKLFEWEKAKGIGPEASTIALLHPGYAPVVVENRGVVVETKREKSPGLARSLSMDSIAPNPSASSISHQPSSLSLNDADELKDVDKDSGSNRRVSSNPELELAPEREEPGAVLVEVEDEVLEVADPLLPVLPGDERRQSTTLGVNQKAKEPGYSSRPSSNSSTILKDSTKLLIRLSEQDSVDRDEVRRLKIVLRALIATLPEFVETGSRNSIAFFVYMKDLALDVLRHLHRFDDGSLGGDAGTVLANVQTINGLVAELKKSLHSYMKYATGNANGRTKDEDIPQISITPALGAQATSSIQRTEDSFRSMATINVTPTFVCNAVRVNTVELVQPTPSSRRFPVSSESELAPLTSQSPDSSAHTPDPAPVEVPSGAPHKDSPEKEGGAGKKLQRNLSNGSRRKTRIKRMGSRQSSKTESDSDDSPQNYVLDVPRKTKRKTSRAKKPSADSLEKLSAGPERVVDDVVYVLKIRPGQKIEQVERPQPQNASLGCVPQGPGDDVLISPQETCVELMEAPPNPTVTTSVLVKTKRKLFTAVDGEGAGALGSSGSVNQTVAISHDLESSSGNDPETVVHVVLAPSPQEQQKLVTNLPPLPQSPGMQRRVDHSKAPAKELSPNIRLMIAKYNQRLTTEKAGGTSPHSSGSCSPVAWRSPVLDRRVRKQTEKYQETIQLSKSASAGSLRKSLRQLEAAQQSFDEAGKAGTGDSLVVVKSSSTSKIEGARQAELQIVEQSDGTREQESSELGTFPAYDSLRRRDTLSRLERSRALVGREQQPTDTGNESSTSTTKGSTTSTGTIKKERLYKKRTESPIASGTTMATGGVGGGKKVTTRGDKYARCRSVPNEECTVEVSISSKALKPPSPRLIARRRLNLEQQHRVECSRSAPTTPLEENRTILSVPMSQRALKLKKAKEEFLRAPSHTGDRMGPGVGSPVEDQPVWSNRISQISATSTASSGLLESDLMLMKSASAGVIGTMGSSITDHESELLAAQLRRNESGSSCTGATSRHSISTIGEPRGSTTTASTSGAGRFGGLSNLASKLRKVKLRRSSKDLSRMHAISALCRQSLMVDISGEAARKMGSAQSLGQGQADAGGNRRDGDSEPLKKSGSVQAICNRFRRSGERNEELKKSRSLGFIEPDRKGS